MPSAHTRLEPFSIQHRPEYVLGYPIHIALTVSNSLPGSVLSFLPHAGWFDPGVGVRLAVRKDDAPADPGPPLYVDSEDGEGCFDLPYGERRRMLTDISALLPPGLSPGVYHFTIRYGTPHASATARFGPVSLRLPDRAEAAAIQQDGWAHWTLYQRPEVPLSVVPSAARFNHVLRTLIFDLDPAPAILDLLDNLYKPEAAAFAVELARIKQSAQWRPMLQAAIQKYSELSWYLRLVELGQGMVTFYRTRALGY